MSPLPIWGQEQEPEATDSLLKEQVYGALLDSVHLWTTKRALDAFEAVAPLSQADRALTSATLTGMKAARYTRELYSLFFRVIIAAQSNSKLASTSFSSLLEMEKKAILSYKKTAFKAKLRFLERFLTENILYTSPQQQWSLGEGGSIHFYFEDAKPEAPPAPIEVAEAPAPLPEETEQETLSQTAQNQDDWDDWGYEEGDNIAIEEQAIDDWDATEAGDVLDWGNTVDPYQQTATTVDADALYDQLSTNMAPLPTFVDGAVIELKGCQLQLKTPTDSLTIEQVEGRFSILGAQFETTKAHMKWPAQGEGLENHALRFNRLEGALRGGRLQAQNVVLEAPQYGAGEIEGVFKASIKKGHFYPVFHSNSAHLTINLPYKQVEYTGGLTLRDKQLMGEGIAGQPGLLRIKSSETAYLQAKSKRFVFNPKQMYAGKARVALYHGVDSISHPEIRLKYEVDSSRLLLSRQKPYEKSAFFSSYLGMYMDVDALDWTVSEDEVLFYLLRGQAHVPALFESDAFFSRGLFSEARGQLSFHPLLVVARFAKESKTHTFLLNDVAKAYHIDWQKLQTSTQYLHEQRYVDYESSIDLVKIREKGFHYALAALGYRDYDRLQIPSRVSTGANAVFSLKTQELLVRGVGRFYFTPDRKMYADPEGNSLRLSNGKNFYFDGKVSANTFLYEGENFYFDYKAYSISMPKINNLRLQVLGTSDSTLTQGNKTANKRTRVINGGLGSTSGVLYISPPQNRAGRNPAPKYPRFDSESDADIYFDDPLILSGAYDRSVRFVAPPFEVDSINDPNFMVVGFEGVFHAGKILPPMYQKLSIMPDKSMGFRHKITEKAGYALYGLPKSYLHGEMRLDLGGIQAKGTVEHHTTALNSKKFTLYLDKVTADVQKGAVRAGSVSGLEQTSYPSITFDQVKLLWQVSEDHMLLKTTSTPMQVYKDKVQFTGTLNIKSTSALAAGTLKTEAVEITSQFLHLKEQTLVARKATFEVRATQEDTAAVRGKDIKLVYDVQKNIATMHAEHIGVPSIDFPALRMRTSMNEAIWDNTTHQVEMHRPDNVPLEQSFFESTHPDMDGLSFQAEKATYSIDSSQLHVEGVPYLRVLNVDIVPENNSLLVREGTLIDPFLDATLHMDAERRYHTFIHGNIKVHGSQKFTGKAQYQYAIADTFLIKFDQFFVERVKGDDKKYQEVVVSNGYIPEVQKFKASEGFYFKGDTKMYANRKDLLFDGYVRLSLAGEDRDLQWIRHRSDENKADIVIDFDRTRTEEGNFLSAGLHYREYGGMYLNFMQDKENEDDIDIFEPEGLLRYDSKTHFYVISPETEEEKPKNDPMQATSVYSPKTFMYAPQTDDIFFEGPLQLLGTDRHLELVAAAQGQGNLTKNICALASIAILDMDLPTKVVQAMGKHMQDARMYLGGAPSWPRNLYKLLAFCIGKKAVERYEMRLRKEG